jgi:flagellar biosynthesis protein FlhF
MIRIKSYFANTVEEALVLGRQDFGDDALLLESKRTREGEQHLGAYEVVIGCPRSDASASPSPAGAMSAGEPATSPANDTQDIHAELERMSNLIQHLAANTLGMRMAELQPLAAELARADLAPELVHQVLHGIPARSTDGGARSTPALRLAARDLLSRMIRCEPDLGRIGAGQRAIALVGPPGCGKTTTLVKLAMRLGLQRQQSIAFVTTDTYRIAAVDQLQAYSAILGVPCAVVEHGSALAHALNSFKGKDLVLIDTPGFAPGDWDLAAEWSRALLAHRQIATQLVLSAASRTADVGRLLGDWRIFDPQSLVFTHLDETAATGSILTAAIHSGLPISFLSAGQSVPEDLDPASEQALLAFLAQPAAARCAAA